MSGITIASLLLAVLPVNDGPTREFVDMIEVNHFYDENGKLVFDQEIFYDWDHKLARHQVRAWRIIKSPAQIPRFTPRPGINRAGVYRVVWQDGEVLRHVESLAFRETWTQYDVELAEREVLPKEKRRELLSTGRDKPRGAAWRRP